MKLSPLGYAFLCVTAPLLWGLFIVWASARVENRLRNRHGTPKDDEPPIPPVDYHI